MNELDYLIDGMRKFGDAPELLQNFNNIRIASVVSELISVLEGKGLLDKDKFFEAVNRESKRQFDLMIKAAKQVNDEKLKQEGRIDYTG